MSWLKTIGKIMSGALTLAEIADPGLAPIIGAARGVFGAIHPGSATPSQPSGFPLGDGLSAIAADAIKIESIFAALYPDKQTGAQKIEALTPLAVQTLLASPLSEGKKLLDSELARSAAGQIAGGVAMWLNAHDPVK